MWTSDWQLQIDLGSGASIEPGDQLAFKAGPPGLRTKNSVSDANTLSFIVTAPLQVIVPEISLLGNSVSDMAAVILVTKCFSFHKSGSNLLRINLLKKNCKHIHLEFLNFKFSFLIFNNVDLAHFPYLTRTLRAHLSPLTSAPQSTSKTLHPQVARARTTHGLLHTLRWMRFSKQSLPRRSRTFPPALFQKIQTLSSWLHQPTFLAPSAFLLCSDYASTACLLLR
jgi:hypothetical protein